MTKLLSYTICLKAYLLKLTHHQLYFYHYIFVEAAEGSLTMLDTLQVSFHNAQQPS